MVDGSLVGLFYNGPILAHQMRATRAPSTTSLKLPKAEVGVNAASPYCTISVPNNSLQESKYLKCLIELADIALHRHGEKTVVL